MLFNNQWTEAKRMKGNKKYGWDKNAWSIYLFNIQISGFDKENGTKFKFISIYIFGFGLLMAY